MSSESATSFVICGQPPCRSLIVIWLSGSGLPFRTTAFYWFGNWRYCSCNVDFEQPMHTHSRGDIKGWRNIGLVIIWPTLRDGYMLGVQSGGSECCCSFSLPTPSFWRIIRVSSSIITQGRGLSGIWQDWSSLSWQSGDSRRCKAWCCRVQLSWYFYGSWLLRLGSLNTPIFSGAPRCIDHYGFALFVAEYVFDPAAAYFVHLSSAEIYWSSFRPGDCWFSYTFVDGRAHRLSRQGPIE